MNELWKGSCPTSSLSCSLSATAGMGLSLFNFISSCVSVFSRDFQAISKGMFEVLLAPDSAISSSGDSFKIEGRETISTSTSLFQIGLLGVVIASTSIGLLKLFSGSELFSVLAYSLF